MSVTKWSGSSNTYHGCSRHNYLTSSLVEVTRQLAVRPELPPQQGHVAVSGNLPYNRKCSIEGRARYAPSPDIPSRTPRSAHRSRP